MRCPLKDEDLILYYYEELSEKEMQSLGLHLKECKDCSSKWSTLKGKLDQMTFSDPELDERFWQGLAERISQKVSTSRKSRTFLFPVLKPALFLLLIIVMLFTGYRWYITQKEEQFIVENRELLENLELIENLELLEHLEELEKYLDENVTQRENNLIKLT